MEEFRNKEDYREAVLRLDGLHSSYRSESRFLMLFKKLELPKNQMILILRIYNGTTLWMQKIDRNCLDEMRRKSEVQGTYYSFCELLKQSIENNKYDLLQFDNELSIIFYFVLTRDVQLRGGLEMDQGVPIVMDDDTRQLQNEFVFDLYDALKCNQVVYTKEVDMHRRKKIGSEFIDIERIPDQKPPPPKKNLLVMGQEALELDDFIKKKPKTNQDIIQPNQKKRKQIGAKID